MAEFKGDEKFKFSFSYNDIEGIVKNEMGLAIHPDHQKFATTILATHLGKFKEAAGKPVIQIWIKTRARIHLPKPVDSDSHQFVFCFGRYIPNDITYQAHVVIWIDDWSEAVEVVRQAMMKEPRILEVVSRSYPSEEVERKMETLFPWVKLTPVGVNRSVKKGIAELKHFLQRCPPGPRGIEEFGWKRKATEDGGPAPKRNRDPDHDDESRIQLKNELSRAQREIAELKKALSPVEGENAELKRMLQSAQESHDRNSAQLKEAESRIESLLHNLKRAKYERELAEMSTNHRTLSGLEHRITKIQLQLAELNLESMEGELKKTELKLKEAVEALKAAEMNPEWRKETERKMKEFESRIKDLLESEKNLKDENASLKSKAMTNGSPRRTRARKAADRLG